MPRREFPSQTSKDSDWEKRCPLGFPRGCFAEGPLIAWQYAEHTVLGKPFAPSLEEEIRKNLRSCFVCNRVLKDLEETVRSGPK